jgi:hypothetical protein
LSKQSLLIQSLIELLNVRKNKTALAIEKLLLNNQILNLNDFKTPD